MFSGLNITQITIFRHIPYLYNAMEVSEVSQKYSLHRHSQNTKPLNQQHIYNLSLLALPKNCQKHWRVSGILFFCLSEMQRQKPQVFSDSTSCSGHSVNLRHSGDNVICYACPNKFDNRWEQFAHPLTGWQTWHRLIGSQTFVNVCIYITNMQQHPEQSLDSICQVVEQRNKSTLSAQSHGSEYEYLTHFLTLLTSSRFRPNSSLPLWFTTGVSSIPFTHKLCKSR